MARKLRNGCIHTSAGVVIIRRSRKQSAEQSQAHRERRSLMNADFRGSACSPELTRRTFLQLVGTGLVVAVADPLSLGAAAADDNVSRRFSDATHLMAGKV